MISEELKAEHIKWLIERFDNHRSSTANRAAIVLSADAILATGNIFLFDTTLSSSVCTSCQEKIMYPSTVITFFLLIISIYLATQAIANVWKLAKDMFGYGINRGFFHAGTISTYHNYSDFATSFNEQTPEDVLETSLGELWVVANQHHKRYQFLRQAIFLLVLSMIPISVSIITMLVCYE